MLKNVILVTRIFDKKNFKITRQKKEKKIQANKIGEIGGEERNKS
jgi:hypothetical protein